MEPNWQQLIGPVSCSSHCAVLRWRALQNQIRSRRHFHRVLVSRLSESLLINFKPSCEGGSRRCARPRAASSARKSATRSHPPQRATQMLYHAPLTCYTAAIQRPFTVLHSRMSHCPTNTMLCPCYVTSPYHAAQPLCTPFVQY